MSYKSYATRNKYGNVKTEVNGIKFDSKAEATYYVELLRRYNAGEIKDLKLQPTFTLQEAFKTPSGENVKAITYKADFSFRIPLVDNGGETYWKLVVVDVKGVRTEVYKLKRKMMLEKFGIEIQEVKQK